MLTDLYATRTNPLYFMLIPVGAIFLDLRDVSGTRLPRNIQTHSS